MSNKTKVQGHDYSTIIIWSSILVGMIRYAAAFLASDLGIIEGMLSEVVTFLLGVSGFFMGIHTRTRRRLRLLYPREIASGAVF